MSALIRKSGATIGFVRSPWNCLQCLKWVASDTAGYPLGPDAYVFGDEIGRPIKRPKKAWSTACRKAAIMNLRFHDLRYEAASRLHELGWPLHHVLELVGHASLSTTNTYLNIRGRSCRRRCDELMEFEKFVAMSLQAWSKQSNRYLATMNREVATNIW